MIVDAGSPLVGPAEEPGPLWSRGVRRPGPNRWGFDWHAPRLEPVKRADNAHHVNRAAYEFLTSADTFARRRQIFTVCLKRKRRGTRDAPVRRKRGIYEADALEVRRNGLRADGFEGLIRLLAWVSWHVDWRSSRVGLWQEGKGIKFQSRASMAERAGFPVRVDDKQRVRAYAFDDRMEDAIAAGLVFRHELERKCAVEFKVTRLFWVLVGVQPLRERYGQQERKQEIQAEREKRARRDQIAPELAVTVASLANARRNDTSDYVEPGTPWPPRVKPPDK